MALEGEKMRPPAEGRAGQEPLGAASDSRACSGDNRAGEKFLREKETVPCHLVPSAALLCACREQGGRTCRAGKAAGAFP